MKILISTGLLVHLRKVKRSLGFSLLEMLVVLAIGSILSGFVIARVGSLGAPNALIQSTEQVASLLEHVRAEALAECQPMTLVLLTDGDKAQRTLTRARSENNQTQLAQRWQELPRGVIVETAFTSHNYPNSFASSEGLVSEEELESGEAIRSITFNKYGALCYASSDTETLRPYYKEDGEQKGCYLILRRARKTSQEAWKPILTTEEELSTASLLYISPLTGRVSNVSYQ